MEIDVIKVTSRGQIVIPTGIRKELGIKSGEKLLAYDKDDTIVLKPLRSLEGKSVEAEIEKIFAPAWNISKKKSITEGDISEEIKRYRKEKRKND